MELTTTLLEPGRAFLSKVAAFLPSLLAALLILLVGWAVAKFVRLAIFRALLAVRFDTAAERAGIDDLLGRADISQSAAELVATLVYWLTNLLVLMTAVNVLGLTSVSDLLNQILLYVPKVIAAVVVLILGLFFANFLSGVVKTAAANANVREAELFGSVARYAVIVFTGAIALQELGIGAELVRSAFNIVFGAVALALALAFGLGSKDIARDWLIRYIEQSRERKKPHS